MKNKNEIEKKIKKIIIKNINEILDYNLKEFLQKHKNLDYRTKLYLFFTVCILKTEIYIKIIKNEKKILKKLKEKKLI